MTGQSGAEESYAACKPNISGAGRRRRRQIGIALAVGAGALTAAFVVLRVAWYTRLFLFLPVAGAAISLLQVSRNTCVAHAAAGTFEHEDFSTTKQSADDAAASRRVAATIYRDALLLGAGAAVLAAATALLR